MNNQLQSILHCPRCQDKFPNHNLGSISAEGYVILKRNYGKYTMVMAETYSIICDCGYFIRINEGKIVADATSTMTFKS